MHVPVLFRKTIQKPINKYYSTANFSIFNAEKISRLLSRHIKCASLDLTHDTTQIEFV